MSAEQKDPFERPLDSYRPIVMPADEAKKRIAEVASEEQESADDLFEHGQERYAGEIEHFDEVIGEADTSDLDDYDDLLNEKPE